MSPSAKILPFRSRARALPDPTSQIVLVRGARRVEWSVERHGRGWVATDLSGSLPRVHYLFSKASALAVKRTFVARARELAAEGWTPAARPEHSSSAD